MIRHFRTVFGEKALLADEEWDHINHKHPEVGRYSNRIRAVLISPDIVKISKKDPAVHLYYKYFDDIFEGKYLLIAVNNQKRKIITVFITDKIKVGEVLWQRK